MSIETTLLAVRNPQWVTIRTPRLDSNNKYVLNSDGSLVTDVLMKDGNPFRVIACETKWSHLGDSSQDWTPFDANPEDVEQHGRDLYTALVNGEHGAIADE